MAKKLKQVNKTVDIKDITVDPELYPRMKHNWQTAFEYSESMKCGSVFPKIILAINNGTLYLVDGKHRIEANKICKLKKIEAIIYHGLSRNEIYKMAVKLNVAHGLGLSTYDKRRAVLKLMEMGVKGKEISLLTNVQEDKLETFVEQRMVSSITGKPINANDDDDDSDFFASMGQQVLKTSVKHFVGSSGTDAVKILQTQKYLSSSNQLNLWKDVVHILEKDLLDTEDPKIQILFRRAKNLMRNITI